MINIANLITDQNDTAKKKDLIPLAQSINDLLSPQIPAEPTLSTNPLIASVDMEVPAYSCCIVTDYFFTPINSTLTLNQGSIFRII